MKIRKYKVTLVVEIRDDKYRKEKGQNIKQYIENELGWLRPSFPYYLHEIKRTV